MPYIESPRRLQRASQGRAPTNSLGGGGAKYFDSLHGFIVPFEFQLRTHGMHATSQHLVLQMAARSPLSYDWIPKTTVLQCLVNIYRLVQYQSLYLPNEMFCIYMEI